MASFSEWTEDEMDEAQARVRLGLLNEIVRDARANGQEIPESVWRQKRQLEERLGIEPIRIGLKPARIAGRAAGQAKPPKAAVQTGGVEYEAAEYDEESDSWVFYVPIE